MRPLILTVGLIFSALAPAQVLDNATFEVASVKRSPPPDPNGRVFFGPPRGGPGTRDPEQITWTNAALRNILMTAFDVQTFQVAGPDWISPERYDIIAKVPVGATKQQVNVMWQNLLKERFGLLVHHESKAFTVDELTIAKSGPKLKVTDLPADAEPFTPSAGPPKPAKNGALEMNGSGAIITIFFSPSGTPEGRMTAKGLSASEIALRLGQQLRHPVIDKTGLTGKYDFSLEYTPDLTGVPPPPPGLAGPNPPPTPIDISSASAPGSTLASALEKQLGLKLVSTKAKLDVIVVDRAEKTPTEN
ncbi:MAG: TIGR03435 family protein [Bryobacterales bacterium]|nr:TIGR03435 family protein [Bryobacterales bacterium]